MPFFEAGIDAAVREVTLVAAAHSIPWVLVGGQALWTHGVPRRSPGVDVLVGPTDARGLAFSLQTHLGWRAVRSRCEHVTASVVTTDGVVVQILPAQAGTDLDVLADPTAVVDAGTTIPVAPLGGVLQRKLRAGRAVDLAAVEQTAEHCNRRTMERAMAWVSARNPSDAARLREMVETVWSRRRPLRTTSVSARR